MAVKGIPFWEEGYKDIDNFTFSSEPNKTIKEFEKLIHKQADILEAGCGEGQNALYLILCFGTLHFVEKDLWKQFIKHAKENTKTGGIHMMQIFTDTVPASEDIAEFAVGLAKEEELKELYGDWKILQFQSYVFEDEHPNVPKHFHASNKIVAQKIEA